MILLKHYRILRLSLVLFAVVAQCVALNNLWLLLVAGTLVVLSWYFTEGPKSNSLPKWMSRLAVVGALAITLFNSQPTTDNLPQVLGQFFVWLTVIKLFGGRSAENDAQELLLSIVLMTVAGLYATDLLFGAILVVWGGLAAWVFMLYQLYYGVETMRIERYAAVPKSYGIPWTRPVTGRRIRAAFRKTASVLLIVGLLLSTAFFFFVPRAFTDESRNLGKLDGGSSRLELSPKRDLTPLQEQVMVVQLVDSEGVTFQLPEPLRLRGSVLEEYEGDGVWKSSYKEQAKKIEAIPDQFTKIVHENVSNPITMHVSLQRPTKHVYSLHKPLSIETNTSVFVSYTPNLHTMKFSTVGSLPTKYSVQVTLDPYILSDDHSAQVGGYKNAAVESLANGILAEHNISTPLTQFSSEETKSQVSQLFVEYLTSNAFQYATDQSLLDPEAYAYLNNHEDPAEAFLLTMQSGHCEYFAASMVAMCDTVGLPSRIVTGYLTDRWDPTTKQYIVLDSDAHAWVETEISPGIWRAYDPTPPTTGSPTAHQSLGWLDAVRFAWLRLDREWKLHVLGFDADSQRHLMQTVFPTWREKTREVWEGITTTGALVVNWFDVGTGGLLWIVLVVVSIAGVSTVIVVVVGKHKRIRTSLALHNTATASLVSDVEFYSETIKVLERAGYFRPPWQPAKLWIKAVQMPSQAKDILENLTEQYYQIRFGKAHLNRSKRLALASSVSDLAVELRKDSV
jgi:hypothetical protein